MRLTSISCEGQAETSLSNIGFAESHKLPAPREPTAKFDPSDTPLHVAGIIGRMFFLAAESRPKKS